MARRRYVTVTFTAPGLNPNGTERRWSWLRDAKVAKQEAEQMCRTWADGTTYEVGDG